MVQTWTIVTISCVQCGQVAELKQVECSSDGQLRFLCACHQCKHMVQWLPFATQLAHLALMKDIERSVEIKATLAVPLIPAPAFNEEDGKFLTDLNIIFPQEDKDAA